MSLLFLIMGLINTLRPRQNGRHFPDNIFKCIFLNENVWTMLNNLLKFVHKIGFNNIPALVQIMPWRRWGDKLLSEQMMVSLLTHICATRGLFTATYNQNKLIISCVKRLFIIYDMKHSFLINWGFHGLALKKMILFVQMWKAKILEAGANTYIYISLKITTQHSITTNNISSPRFNCDWLLPHPNLHLQILWTEMLYFNSVS